MPVHRYFWYAEGSEPRDSPSIKQAQSLNLRSLRVAGEDSAPSPSIGSASDAI
jgi:hypothetical protein